MIMQNGWPSYFCSSSGHLRDPGTCPCHHTPGWPDLGRGVGGYVCSPTPAAAHPTEGDSSHGPPLPSFPGPRPRRAGGTSGPRVSLGRSSEGKEPCPPLPAGRPCITSIRCICCPEAARICLRSRASARPRPLPMFLTPQPSHTTHGPSHQCLPQRLVFAMSCCQTNNRLPTTLPSPRRHRHHHQHRKKKKERNK